MRSGTLKKWIDTSDSGLESLLHHRFLKPPYGYVIGVALWPVFMSIISVWAVLQSGLPSSVVTVGGLVVGVGSFVVTSTSSALVMGVTAWNAPYKRIQRQFAFLFLSLLLAVPLFGLYLNWPTVPYRYELGLSAFVAHELSKIVFLGPAIGFTFVISPLVILIYRYYLK